MKKLFVILAILPITIHAQAINMHGYVSYYNAANRIPDSVIYTAQPHVKTAHRASCFYGKPNLNKSYLHSGYDIGHNADAEDMNGSLVTEHESFNFVNTYPQLPALNRVTWLALENYVRSLKQPVKVKISWIGIKTKIGPDSITVPAQCVKEIWYNGHNEKYIMPNQDTVTRHSFIFYRVN